MTARARVGRSDRHRLRALIRRFSRIECRAARAPSRARRSPWMSTSKTLPGGGEFGRRRTRRRDSSRPGGRRRPEVVTPMQRSLDEHGLAAARVGVGGLDLGVDDLEEGAAPGRASPPCRRNRPCSKSMKRGMSASSMFSSLVSSARPRLVAFLHPHAIDRVQAVIGDAEFPAGSQRASYSAANEPIGGCSSQPSSPT